MRVQFFIAFFIEFLNVNFSGWCGCILRTASSLADVCGDSTTGTRPHDRIILANKSSGKKILNTTFYPYQKRMNKFISGKSELKGNKQAKTKNFELDRKCPKYGCDDKKVVRPVLGYFKI